MTCSSSFTGSPSARRNCWRRPVKSGVCVCARVRPITSDTLRPPFCSVTRQVTRFWVVCCGCYTLPPCILLINLRTCTTRASQRYTAHRLDKLVWDCSTAVLYPDVAWLPDELHAIRGPATTSSSAVERTKQSLDEQQQVGDDDDDDDTHTYAVEIKPKQGWWRPTDATDADVDGDDVDDDAADRVAATKCRFCSLQFLKVYAHHSQRRTRIHAHANDEKNARCQVHWIVFCCVRGMRWLLLLLMVYV